MCETVTKLEKIFNNNQSIGICVLGTTCCGKSTLQKEFPEAIDMDDALWPTLSEKEEAYICQKHWTEEIGIFTSKIVKERVKIFPVMLLHFYQRFTNIYRESDLQLTKARMREYTKMSELKKHIYDASNRLYYTLVGDYYIPELKLPMDNKLIDKYIHLITFQ